MYARAHDARRLTLSEYAELPEDDGYRMSCRDRASGPVLRLNANDELDGSPVLPEWRVRVAELFAWP